MFSIKLRGFYFETTKAIKHTRNTLDIWIPLRIAGEVAGLLVKPNMKMK